MSDTVLVWCSSLCLSLSLSLKSLRGNTRGKGGRCSGGEGAGVLLARRPDVESTHIPNPLRHATMQEST